ncbi:MAG: hypothetical protein MPJ50_02160 [Pirellulales bacterium]|nr:hypothetical protein [Pirellulales bacterium]
MSESPQQQASPPQNEPPGSGLRFGTGTLLFAFTMAILMAAACGGLVRTQSVGAQDAKMLIFALPLGGMIVASILRALAKWFDGRSQ